MIIKITEDKANHIIYGTLLFILLRYFKIPIIISTIIIFLLSIIRELYNLYIGPTDYIESILDIFSSMIGIFTLLLFKTKINE